MVRAIIILCLLVGLSSCTQKLICPAYQSSFIYDKTAQREKFVYYNASTTQPKEILASNSNTITLPPRDSTWAKSDALRGPALPQVRRVKQDRYLLLPEKTYKQALKALRTVEMKPVYPKKQDSLDIANELDSAARSITDTLTAQAQAKPKPQEDSVYVITKTKEKYNMDQDAYMWYFRDILVLPDVRAAMMEESKVQKAKNKSSPKKKEGFFNKLFKKKEKPDSTRNLNVVNSTDSTEAKPPKKGLGGLFKKKSKVSEPDAQKKADPAKKEEEDDGF